MGAAVTVSNTTNNDFIAHLAARSYLSIPIEKSRALYQNWLIRGEFFKQGESLGGSLQK